MFTLTRSEAMRRAMRHGIEGLRQELLSGHAHVSEATSRSASKARRRPGQRQENLWRLPVHEQVSDALFDPLPS